MSLWKVELCVMAHSTGRGSDTDQKQAGARKQEYEISAESLREALGVAEAVGIGIKQNPIVYKVEVQSIVPVSRDGYQSFPLVRCLTDRPDAYID